MVLALGTQLYAMCGHVLSSVSWNNSCLLINNQFRFQGNRVKASRIGESIRSVCVPIFLCLELSFLLSSCLSLSVSLLDRPPYGILSIH
jgi:hypothetical protein